MSFWRRAFAAILLIGLVAGSSALALQNRTVNDGVYTEQQAARGQALYGARCASCHGQNLAGRVGPPVAGTDFLAEWSGKPLLELFDKVRLTMPKDDSDRLSAAQAADVLAYMFQYGKIPAGRTDLPTDAAALKQLTLPIAAGTAAAPASAAAGQMPSLPAAGNVAAVMRGILFPSANILFTTQTVDPGEKKPPAESGGTGGFDWLTWGGGVYRGWDIVDYAAVSVAESAKLMLTPGRKCENGRLVPVSDPDWIKFTIELADAGKAAYAASQTRKQETIADSTNQLNESCEHCHRMFRGRTHCAKP